MKNFYNKSSLTKYIVLFFVYLFFGVAYSTDPIIDSDDDINAFEISQNEFSGNSAANIEQDNLVGKINSINSKIFINPKKLSCDIQHVETGNFSFTNPSNIIYYTIISKKTPFSSFEALLTPDSSINPKDIAIESINIYQDKSFKERTFIDDYMNSMMFRDRWVIAVTLNRKITNIEIDFSYKAERAILINTKNNSNYVKLSLFNPYSESFPYRISLILSEFKNLRKELLDLPLGALTKDFTYMNSETKKEEKGIEIQLNRVFDSHSQYEFLFNLPMEITSCDNGFYNFIYYGMVGITVVFIFFALLAVIYVYKE